MSKTIFSLIIISIALLSLPMRTKADNVPANKTFTVVLDAGHGGKDPGAVGRISREKNINLSVALALGKLIEKNCSDTRVIYTRKSDVFIPLDRRAQIANKAKANLFISIHTNAMPGKKIARGTETYTMGMARAKENLDVAKRENSVILVEDDYKTRYEGFDPRSSESYIIFELMQDKYMEQSVSLARNIQKEFKNTARRADRGVHQAGFLVLRATTMPSVLVELGYITTADEERYLNSAQGINKLAESLYNAFTQYKKTHLRKATPATATATDTQQTSLLAETAAATLPENSATETTAATPIFKSERKEPATPMAAPQETMPQTERKAPAHTENTATTETDITPVSDTQSPQTTAGSNERPVTSQSRNSNGQDTIWFKVQILTSSRQLHVNSSHFKGLKQIGMYKEDNLYKYTYGSTTEYQEAVKMKKEIREQFPGAFIIAFRNDIKMPLADALKTKRN